MPMHELAWSFPVFREIAGMVDDLNAEIISHECDEDALSDQVQALMDYVEAQQNRTSAGELHLKIEWKSNSTGRVFEMEFNAKVSQR